MNPTTPFFLLCFCLLNTYFLLFISIQSETRVAYWSVVDIFTGFPIDKELTFSILPKPLKEENILFMTRHRNHDGTYDSDFIMHSMQIAKLQQKTWSQSIFDERQSDLRPFVHAKKNMTRSISKPLTYNVTWLSSSTNCTCESTPIPLSIYIIVFTREKKEIISQCNKGRGSTL